jgi:hypothetical protein
MKIPKVMGLGIYLLVLALSMFADIPVSAKSQFTYNFILAPDMSGNLNGRIDLGYSWNPWLFSGAAGYTDNYVQSFNTSTDISSLNSSSRAASLTALKVNQDLLWLLVGKELDFLSFSAGLVGIYDVTSQKQYGYDPTTLPSPVFYLDSTEKTSLRPIQSYTLGLNFGPLALGGKFESTIVWAREKVTSSHFLSSMASPPTATTISYNGGDTLAGGSLSLDLKAIRLIGSFEYFLHVMTDGTTAHTFKSDTYTYGASAVLTFMKLSGGSPVIGVSAVNKLDYIVASKKSISNDAIRFEFGLRY